MTAIRNWLQAEAASSDDGRHVVRLDGRELRLPDGALLRIEGAALAEAIAGEWQAAGGGARGGAYSFSDLTLTRLAATETVHLAADRDGAIETLLRAADTDMLCYRAISPEGLVQRQMTVWQPWLDRIEAATGARFAVTEGVMPAGQGEDLLAALRAGLERQDAARLAALLAVVPALGSLVLGLAFVAGELPPAEAALIATLEAEWEAERWGEPEAWLATRDRLAAELVTVGQFLDLRARA